MNVRRCWVAVVGMTLVLAACGSEGSSGGSGSGGGGGGGGAVPKASCLFGSEEIVGRFASEICAELAQCCETNQRGYDAARCFEWARSTMCQTIGSATTQQLKIDGAKAAACVNAAVASAKTCAGGNEVAVNAACADIAIPSGGTVAPGGSCQSTADCAVPVGGSAYCNPDRGKLCEVRKPGAEGETCDGSGPSRSECGETTPFFCADGVCRARVPAGGACGQSNACSAGTSCAEGTCAPLPTLGQSCEIGRPCDAASVCDYAGTKTCVARKATAEACSTNEECVSGLCAEKRCETTLFVQACKRPGEAP